jgi:hypothetical protein
MVRLLLILAAFAVVLCGCDQESTPVQEQEKEHGAEQVAPKPVTEVQAVTEPTVSKPALVPESTTSSTNAPGGMSGEQTALAEVYCRMVTYASKEGMSQQEVSAFLDKTTQRSVKEMEDDPSLSAGVAGNRVLDDLDVPRYPQCKIGAGS